jgi:hypothetical protein
VTPRIWREWREARALTRRASAYVGSIRAEPDEADTQWLAACATNGDVDHARWELRYARRALGLIAAQRDALDDRTPSAVARELTASLAREPLVDAAKLEVAERQFNQRLRAYSDVLGERRAGEPTAERLGRTLLGFAGGRTMPAPGDVSRAGALVSAYLAEGSASLQQVFGAAELPEHVPPSVAAAERG